MADYIRPTPRNPVLGLLADALMGGLAYMEDPRRTQQMRGVGGLLSETGIAQTIDRLASGEPLTKGKGFATRMKPETAAAAMTLAPEALPIGRAAMRAVRATEGLPVGAGIVYHGSPYRFQRFDPTKIGSGEGAQAYGYGHYVAESPGVAKQYAENVKDMGSVQRINAELSRLSKIMNADEVPGAYRKYRSDEGRKAAEQYDALMAQREQVRTAPGSLYTIDLPDPAIARMLDWDKPLSQQEGIRKALTPESMGLTLRLPVDGGFMAYLGANGKPIGVQMKGVTPEKFREHWLNRLAEVGDLEGGAGRAVGYLGGTSISGELAPAVSGAMRQAGIPGIRYLDQGSRGAGAGTSNFVIFPGEEDLLRILNVEGGLLGR